MSAIERSNRNIRSFNCDKCSSRFEHRYQLNNHLRVHTNERPFECNVCGSKFKFSSHLKRHEYTHRDECPYKCVECGKSFKTQVYLERHSISHSNERQFICNICGKAFKIASHLKRHEYTHRDDCPYKCVECDKSFKTQVYLQRHLISHSNERPFNCNICDSEFKRRTNLNKHLLVVHKKERSLKQIKHNFKHVFVCVSNDEIRNEEEIDEESNEKMSKASNVKAKGNFENAKLITLRTAASEKYDDVSCGNGSNDDAMNDSNNMLVGNYSKIPEIRVYMCTARI